MDYFIRLRYSYTKLKEAVDLIAGQCSAVVLYEHDDKSENIHIHALLKGCKVSTDTLKNYVRKFIGSVPKTHWSFKSATNDECIIYMSKGNLEPSFVHNYDIERIQKYKEEWVDKKRYAQKTLIQYTVKENPKEAKLRQNEMIDEIITRLKKTDDWSEMRIIALIRQVVIIENKNLLGRFKARDYYDTIRAKIVPERWDVMIYNLVKPREDIF